MSTTGSLSGVIDLVPLRPDAPVETPLREVVTWLGDRLVGRTGDADPVVTGLTISSLRVQPGDLYVAPAGARSHGATYTARTTNPGGGSFWAGLGWEWRNSFSCMRWQRSASLR